MRVIIAGARCCHHYHAVCQAVRDSGFDITTVISGGADGVDTLGERYAAEHDIPCERHPADWKKYGTAAGPLRNHEMALCADALIAVIMGTSKGTRNMIRQAREAGLPVYVTEVHT
ncbi:MAG: DUF2493 domain-containing protein [Oligosphaeraceae bacterium]